MQAPGIDFSAQPLLEIDPAILCAAVTPVIGRYALPTGMVEERERFATEVCLYVADPLAGERLPLLFAIQSTGQRPNPRSYIRTISTIDKFIDNTRQNLV